MKTFKKVLVAFVLGGILGLGVGGFLGYEIGSVDDRINTATKAGVVEVQQVNRPGKPSETTSVTDAAATETPDEPDATVAPVEAPAAGGTEEFVISPNDTSELMWVGYKTALGVKMSMEGGFANFNGTVVVVNNSPDESYVDVTVDMGSVFSVNSILTTVLKGDDFFSVANHPEAKFESTKIEAADSGYLVTGNFTMHGVTKGVQFPAKIERQGDNVYIEAEFKINRKEWDVGYDSFEDALVLEEVVVSFKMLAEPTEAAPETTAPREVVPAEAAPVEAAPVEAAPVEAAPAEATPAAEEEDIDDWSEVGITTPSQQPII